MNFQDEDSTVPEGAAPVGWYELVVWWEPGHTPPESCRSHCSDTVWETLAGHICCVEGGVWDVPGLGVALIVAVKH